MGLKEQLRADLTAAIRAQDELTRAALRMVLTAVQSAEVAGSAARELTDQQVQDVVRREAKRRREAAQAFAVGGAAERAERELAEERVLTAYLPVQLGDEELASIIDDAMIVATGEGLTGMGAMGAVMTAVRGKVGGRADGARVAAAVRARLQG